MTRRRLKSQVSDEIEKAINETENKGYRFDMLIICNDEFEEQCTILQTILTSLGLRVTINMNDIRPGTSKISGIYQECLQSKHFLVIIDDKPMNKDIEFFVKMVKRIVEARSYGQIVVCKTIPDTKIPSFLSKYLKFEMNLPMMYSKD